MKCIYGFFLIIFLSLLLIFLASPAFGKEIAVVGSGYHVYEDVLQGFISTCDAHMKEYRLEDYDREDLPEKILKSEPALILAVGYDALLVAKEIEDIPVVSVMTFNLNKYIREDSRITGVDIALPVEKQLDELRLVLPEARRVGMLYNPEETGNLVKGAKAAASERGLTIKGRAVRSPREVVSALNSLEGEIDVLWMLQDITVLDYEAIKYIMLFSYEKGISVYAFSEKYVKNSAVMAYAIDVHDIGKQAGEIANRILAGDNVSDIPVTHAIKGNLFLNLSTAERLKIEIPQDAINRASKIYGGKP